MSAIKEWATAVCAVSVLCAALNMIAPPQKYEKLLRVVAACVMICVIASPLANVKSCVGKINMQTTRSQEEQSELSGRLTEQTAKFSASAVESLIYSEIQKVYDGECFVEVIMDINADNCISIGQVTVTVPNSDQYQRQQIMQTVKENLGISAEVREG